MQTRLKFRIVITVFLLAVLALSTITTVVRIPIPLISAMTTMPSNQTSLSRGGTFANMTFLGNMMPRKNMTMPGGNMTFGASLQNAKMHLTEAIMDLNNGNTKGAAMEMNLTAQSIRLREQELKVMMMEIKNMMTAMKASSHIITSKNPAP
jgi:hypothetical protein